MVKKSRGAAAQLSVKPSTSRVSGIVVEVKSSSRTVSVDRSLWSGQGAN